MPVFFFISGFLFCFTNPVERLKKQKYKSFIKKKIIRLLIPFVFINTTIFLIKTLLIKDMSMMQHPLNFDVASFLNVTFINPIGFMWFLPALFMIFLIVYPCYDYLKVYNERVYSFGLCIYAIIVGISTIFLPDVRFMQLTKALYYCTFLFWEYYIVTIRLTLINTLPIIGS